MVKNLPAMWETWVPSLDWEHHLEEGKATNSNILAWRIPWTEQYSCLENPTDRGAWRTTFRGNTESWTQLSI